MCAGILVLEAITLGLSTPVLLTLTDVGTAPALTMGLGLTIACIVVTGMLRAEWAYGAGWVIQVLAIAMGLLVPTMFFIGGLFALLWGTAYFLGKKIEREKAAAWAAYDAEQSA
ncbi:MAG: DUF4233 domain-containing protein [Nocardioides sp.]|nr:DUF4233 domain-containing protein [Nocardioides sp.]